MEIYIRYIYTGICSICTYIYICIYIYIWHSFVGLLALYVKPGCFIQTSHITLSSVNKICFLYHLSLALDNISPRNGILL